MTVDCPCGCGKPIKRILYRTAEHAVYLGALAQVPDHLAHIYARYDRAGAVHMEEFALTGLGYSHSMLNTAHEVPHTLGMPTAKELEDWEVAALRLLHVVNHADPEWFSQWQRSGRDPSSGSGGQ